MRLRWAALGALIAFLILIAGCGGSKQTTPTPIVTGLFPSNITAGSQTFTLNITGIGFQSKPPSQVLWNNSPITSTLNLVNNQLIATVPASDVASPGFANVTVVNPLPGGPSVGISFQIDSVQSSTPFISSTNPFSPANATPGSPAFTLTVNGSNFAPSSIVAWNSGPRFTTFVSSTVLTANIEAEDILQSGFASVSVYTPTPGGANLFSPSVDFSFGTTPSNAFPMIASVAASGGPADGSSASPAVSADGRFVAFYSQAKNLVAHGPFGNIFVRDTCLGATSCTQKTFAVDLAPDGSAPNAEPLGEVATSADGRFVVFESPATNLVAGEQSTRQPAKDVVSLFVRDLCVGAGVPSGCNVHTEAISVDMAGTLPVLGASGSPSISSDGRFIAFSSSANLMAAQTQAHSGSQVFVRDTCAGATATKSCVPHTSQIPLDRYQAAGAEAMTPAISANGRYVAFAVWMPESESDPDTGNWPQVFLHDTCAGLTTPASCVPATEMLSVSSNGERANAPSQSPFISGDGRFVVFQSLASNLAAVAPNEKTNVFLRDTCRGGTASDSCTPSTALLVSQPSTDRVLANSNAYAPWISPSGRYISFLVEMSRMVGGHDFPDDSYLYVQDTCFGVMERCTPRLSPLVIPDDYHSQPVSLRMDQRDAVPIVRDGHIAAFFSTSIVPNAPSSDQGDVLLTLTPFKE